MQRLSVVRQKVEAMYQASNPAADEWIDWSYQNHVLVVADYAEKLSLKHKANVEFVVAAALLHDIGDVVTRRADQKHQQKSDEIAHTILSETGFSENEIKIIIEEIITPHSCNEVLPISLEGKILATADGASHFITDFFSYFCWQHYGPSYNYDEYEEFKKWVLQKIEKHFNTKIFFEDVRKEVRPNFEALKLLYSL